MTAQPMARLMASPIYLALIVACALVGFRDAMAEPYVVLFAVERAHFAPLTLGLFLTLRAIGAVVFSMAFGIWLDRAPSLLPFALALLIGACGYVLMAATTNPVLLLLIACGPLAAGTAAFPQLFALGKRHLDSDDPDTAERGIAIMRATFSAAWGIGPLLGAVLVGRFDFAGVFLVTALCGVAAFVTLGASGLRAPRGGGVVAAAAGLGGNGKVAITSGGFVLFFMALTMGSVALPIVVTQQLGGVTADVGTIMASCAILEVPVMIAVAMRPALLGGFGGLAAGFVAMVAYFVLVTAAASIGAVVAAQVLRAIGIGLVTCVGISYMQELMPNRAGAAAAMFTITGQVGALLAGVSAGSWAQVFGFHSLFLACAVESGLGLVLLSLGARPPPRR